MDSCRTLPLYATGILLVIFFPLYYLGDVSSIIAPLGYSLAYFSVYRPRLLVIWLFAIAYLVVVVLYLLNIHIVLWSVTIATAAAYGLAASVGSGVCRLVSLAVFWAVEQVAAVAVSLPLALLGYRFGAPLPHFWEYPLYIVVYWVIYQTHGRAVNWCQRQIEKPELACKWDSDNTVDIGVYD